MCRRMWQLISQSIQAFNENIMVFPAWQFLLLYVQSYQRLFESSLSFKNDEA